MKNTSDCDFMILASYIDCIDDVRKQFGDDYAEQFAYELVYFGVRNQKIKGLNSICNATLESIYPKIEKSRERLEKKKRESICKTKSVDPASEKQKVCD